MNTSMKLLSIILLFTFFGCATSGNGSSSQNENEIVLAKNLPYHIDSISRLSVQGSGGNVRVVNTASSTVMGDTRPLFILNGMQMGRDLSQIMQLLNSEEELNVDFLTIRMATIRYGEAGKNGAIIIERVSQN